MTVIDADGTYRAGFTTEDAAGAADADATPTGTLYHNGSSTAVAVTVTHPGTGAYVASATLPGTYADADTVEVLVTGAVAGRTFRAWLPAATVGRIALPGDVYRAAFSTEDADGSADADTLPGAAFYHNGTADGAVSVTVAHAATGAYTASATVPGGYSLGDTVQVLVTGAVASVPFAAWLEPVALAATTSPPPTLTADEIADAILNRNIEGGSSSGRLVKEALYVLRNRWAVSSGTLTVYGTDDVTPAFTSALTTDGSAVTVVSSNPNS